VRNLASDQENKNTYKIFVVKIIEKKLFQRYGRWRRRRRYSWQ